MIADEATKDCVLDASATTAQNATNDSAADNAPAELSELQLVTLLELEG
jgi:hypothetical protein